MVGLFLLVALVLAAGRLDAGPPLALEPVIGGLNQPVAVAHAGDSRLFIVLKAGQIRIFDGTTLLATPFLNITALINADGERGLLGLAFHPSYVANGFFYVFYTNLAGDIVIARYTRSGNPNVANPASATILVTIPHPGASNHNGGQLQFGPDGFLYAGVGDGGGGGDPNNNGQSLGTNYLGKILRLDVDNPPMYVPAGNPFPNSLIWAYGLRNPWRFSFDRDTDDLFIADVGQGSREEVNFQPASSTGGENYGWRLREGSACFNPPANCDPGNATVLPILEYDHSAGNCSVTGGYRYRGTRNPVLNGVYLFADFCSGRIFGGIENPIGTWTQTTLLDTALLISTFGEGHDGEVYVADFGGGTLYRVTSRLMAVEAPANGATVSQPFLLGGWAIDGAAAGSGVDAVHVFAVPSGGGGSIFLGAATYGGARPDVGGVFGAQFTSSGFGLMVTGLLPGAYQLQVFARSTVSGAFDNVRTASVTVVSSLRLALDAPVNGTSTVQPLVIGGWAVDLSAPGGTGVETVHVYAFPAGGGAATFLGAASYGGPRPDIGALFGAQFTNSGFGLVVGGLAPGVYQIRAFARSSGTGAFGDPQSVTVTIVSGARMALDAPRSGTIALPPIVVGGWAVDLSAPAGTGVDAIHVYAQPAGGGAPIFLGEATYGGTRPDIGALFGARFAGSGFSLTVNGLAPGSYQILVFARSTATGSFDARTATVTILPSVRISVDTPAPGAAAALPFLVAGWALDLADPAGTGVDAVHVYAFPTAGGPPVFLDVAAYGHARPDVGAIFGARFAASGYQLLVAGGSLPPGSYLLQVFARSSVSGGFSAAPAVPLTVP
jgi:glucose/arabinose dehydrogenase